MPLGVALHGWVVPAMVDSVGLRLPGSVISVHTGVERVALTLGGLRRDAERVPKAERGAVSVRGSGVWA